MEEPLTPVAGVPQPYGTAVPAPRRRRVWIWFVVGGGLVLAFLVVASLLMYTAARALGGEDDGFSSLGDDNIGVIDIDGEILSADTIVDQLRKLE